MLEHTKYPALPEKLARLISYPTISAYNESLEDASAFSGLVEALPALFPKLHSRLEKAMPSTRSLLYTWVGSDPALAPAILCAHFDVVPPGDLEKWRHGPFSGDIAEDAVWGRGAQDIKVLMASIMEAVEELIASGFAPRRTIYLAFGGDEEVGGHRGASAIAASLEKRGVKASFLLDEGGPISVGMLSFATRPIALVSVAEKGYVDILIETRGEPGHASMPPRQTAPGKLARAITAIESRLAPPRLGKSTTAFLKFLAPHSKQPYKWIFGHLGLTAPLVRRVFTLSPTTNALVRTTTAITMLEGSAKENMLAEKASATVNSRILPGDTTDTAIARLEALVSRYGATVKAKHPGHEVQPSSESDTDHEGWKAIVGALGVSHPEAAGVPFLFSAATDTKHYRNLVGATYRFTALPQTDEDLKGVHGYNERVRLKDLDDCARFYASLISGL
jgi:carboxypeptidase PM20D1